MNKENFETDTIQDSVDIDFTGEKHSDNINIKIVDRAVDGVPVAELASGGGAVTSVADVLPDANGNVALTAEDIGALSVEHAFGKANVFNTITDLINAPLEYLEDKIIVYVKGYHATGVGGGFFRWITDSLSPNGGTIFNASVGSWVRILDRPVMPQDFGAIGDGISDDTTALQSFADHICQPSDLGTCAEMIGTYRITDKIEFNGFSQPQGDGRLTLKTSCIIYVDFPAITQGYAITFNGVRLMTQVGSLTVNCRGSVNFDNRTVGNAIMLNDCSLINLDRINVRYAMRDAVTLRGWTTQIYIKYLSVNYCGLVGDTSSMSRQLTITDRVDSTTIGSNHPGQTSTLTVSGYDISELEPGSSFINYDNELYTVANVDLVNSTISVHPWLPLPVSGHSTGTCSIVMGGGISMRGINVSANKVEYIDAIGTGIGCLNQALYPAQIGKLVAQGCGVGYLAASHNSSAIGGGLDSAYFEINRWDIAFLSVASAITHKIGICTNLQLSKISGMYARSLGGNPDGTLHRWPERVTLYWPDLGVELGKKVNPFVGEVLFASSTLTKSIHIDPMIVRYFSHTVREFTVFGQSANGGISGNITLTVPSGYSINGGSPGASAIFTSPDGPSQFLIRLSGSNYSVYQKPAG